MYKKVDHLCGVVVKSSWLQIQRSGFDSRRYQIFWEVVGLELGSLSLVSTTEELLGGKSSCSGLEIWEYGRKNPPRWPCGTLCLQKLALTAPTSGCRSVGIVRSRTQAMEFSLVFYVSSSTTDVKHCPIIHWMLSDNCGLSSLHLVNSVLLSQMVGNNSLLLGVPQIWNMFVFWIWSSVFMSTWMACCEHLMHCCNVLGSLQDWCSFWSRLIVTEPIVIKVRWHWLFMHSLLH
jgi:hypothetical protein